LNIFNKPKYSAIRRCPENILLGLRRWILILALVLAGSPSIFAADITVIVVKSDDILPFDDILTGFTAEMLQQDLQVNMVTLAADMDISLINSRIAQIKPEVILCLGVKAMEAAEQIKDIPKIISLVTYNNLSSWLNSNDGYGVTLDLAPKFQFQIIRRALPEIRKIGVIYDPQQNRKVVEEAKKAATELGLHLQTHPVGSRKEIPQAFNNLENNIELLWTLYDHVVYSPESAKYILMQSLRKRIPVVGFSPHFAKAGALLALYGNYQDMGRQAAVQAIAILHGERKNVRILRPRTLRVAVNEKVGHAIGITFSPQFMKTVHQTY
jgi:putative tryptophan/tyrosine transport system substrate-binding protein